MKLNVVKFPTAGSKLTPRWKELREHETQHALWMSAKRFNVNPAGRRSGKTEIAKRKLVKRAIRETQWEDARFFAAAPTREQAKRIYWDDLKKLTPRWVMSKQPNESEMVIYLVNGATIHVIGMDKPERVEGVGWNGGILDEFGNMKKQAWGEHVRPALSDRNGWCDLIGVPEGRNHYYDLAKKAQAEAMDPASDWGYFHWISSDILDPKEIEDAKNDLDELTYLQEYEASFVNFTGRAYYPFSESRHLARINYNPRQNLILCFDFNVAPGVAAVIQEKSIKDLETGSILVGQTVTGILGEVYIPTNSNTPLVCNKIITDWGSHQGQIHIYGDATGGSKGTAKIGGTDWDLIKQILRRHFHERVFFHVPLSNPSERDRINAVNSRLLTMDGKVRLLVDPGKAPHVVKDFEGVQCVVGGSGEIDKKKSPDLTHLTDAIGYYVHREFPVRRVDATLAALTGI